MLFPAVALTFVRQEPLGADAIYKKCLPSVMTLTSVRPDGTFIGTAFLCVRDGVAATAWHVVNGAQKVTARFSNGEEFEASGLIDKDERRDVALIRVKVADRPPLLLAAADPEVGSKAFAIGAPRGLEFSISDGLVSQIQTLEGVKAFQYTCPTSPGNSGGPLINGKGEVLGVVSWQLRDSQNLNFAVPATYVRGLDATLPTQPWASVKSAKPALETSTKTTPVPSPADAAAFQSAFVAGLWSYSESYAAFENTYDRVIAKGNGYQDGTPVEHLQAQIELRKAIEALGKVSSSESRGEKARLQLIDKLQGYQRALQGEKEAIEIAQRMRGWGTDANDRAKEAFAELATTIKPEGREVLWEFLQTESQLALLPPALKELYQPGGDHMGYSLTILSWPRNPAALAYVPKGGFAYDLGFRTNDVIIEIAGQPVTTMAEVKKAIKDNLGSKVKVRLRRDGKEREIEIKIPRELPKNSVRTG